MTEILECENLSQQQQLNDEDTKVDEMSSMNFFKRLKNNNDDSDDEEDTTESSFDKIVPSVKDDQNDNKSITVDIGSNLSQEQQQQQVNDEDAKDDGPDVEKTVEENIECEKQEIEPNFKLPNLDLMRPSIKRAMTTLNQSAITEQPQPSKQIKGSTVSEMITEMSQLKSTLPPPSASTSKMFGGIQRSMFDSSRNSSNFFRTQSNIPLTASVSKKTSSFSFRIPLSTPVIHRPSTADFQEQTSDMSQLNDKPSASDQTENLNDSMSSYFETSLSAQKSLGLTLRERLLQKINQQRQAEEEKAKVEIPESNETIKQSQQQQQIIIADEQSKNENIIIDDDKESELDVTMESLQEQQQDDVGDDKQDERVLSPITMEQSIVEMLSIGDLSHDPVKPTEIINEMKTDMDEEPEKDYNVTTTEITANFSMMMHDISCMVNDEEMGENIEYSIYDHFNETMVMHEQQKRRRIQIPMFDFINDLDHRKLNVRIQSVSQNLLVLRYLFSTLELRIHFGSIVTTKNFHHTNQYNDEIREIVAIDLISLIDSKKPLSINVIRGREDRPIYNGDVFLLSFKTDEHRRLLYMAQDFILTHFEEKRSFFDKTFKDTSKLKELIEEFSILVTPAKKMACELRTLLSSEVSHLLPKDSDGKIGLDEFIVAFKMIKPCKYSYITKLIKGSRCFIHALRHVMKQNQLARRQSEQIRAMVQFEIPRSA
ncbi:hypothetical protein BLA29_001166 [Euroglyphus maynei]|uniref:Uncharacterized protein n=1 Tax=Euroglyphus maynei TaxID=6958 RepID=A0A1Y3B1C0_EURMA|nr:hypothetical protein BLA29_001166 [Euroglyphus maynei]